jgi:hypothetical protein
MTELQYKNMKCSKIMSLETYLSLMQYVAIRGKVWQTHKRPLSYFYDNTSHRNYLSKLLESIIIKTIRNLGYLAKKQETTGRLIDKTKQYTDVTGQCRTIGSKVWAKNSNNIEGTPDIECFINRYFQIEVKACKDRLSRQQHTTIKKFNAIGIPTYIVKTVEDFKEVLRIELNAVKLIKN